MASYDVFISYRRDGGAAEARLIQSALQARRVHAFLDVTELGRGYFDEALLKSIEQAPNFVVILSPHSLDRAESDEDWLRREIAHALQTERNVVPLIMPGFQFPAKLPEELKNLPRHQGMDYSHLYFDAMMQKLVATLDLSASAGERAKEERAVEERAEQDRAARAALEEERLKVERARLSTERMRQENEARRKSLEMRQAEDLKRREDEQRRGDRPDDRRRLSDRFRHGDLAAGSETRQAALAASWSLGLVSLAFFATASGNEAQGGFTAATVFLALALWVRVSPRQASTTSLVIASLTTIGAVGTGLAQRFDLGRLSLALYAGLAAVAVWRVSRTTGVSSDEAVRPAPESVPFGKRFGDLIGVGNRIDVSRLRLFIIARLAAGLVFWRMVEASGGFFSISRVNYLWVIWVAVALPLALAITFRWLRNPLLSIGVAALIACFVDPQFYRSGFATLTLAGYVVGSFVFAAAIDEIESTWNSVWVATVAANVGGVVLGLLWGARFGGWNQAGPNLYRFTVLCVLFTAVFVCGLALLRRPATTAS